MLTRAVCPAEGPWKPRGNGGYRGFSSKGSPMIVSLSMIKWANRATNVVQNIPNTASRAVAYPAARTAAAMDWTAAARFDAASIAAWPITTISGVTPK